MQPLSLFLLFLGIFCDYCESQDARVLCSEAGELGQYGSVFYVCDCASDAASGCLPGNDTNDGLSPSTSWQSFEQARTFFESSLQPGQTIAFCRGGSWPSAGSPSWNNVRCEGSLISRRCFLRSYGREELPKPLIRAGISFTDGGSPDHDEGYFVSDLHLHGNYSSSGIFIYNDADDITLCNLTITNFHLGVYFSEANSDPSPGADEFNDRAHLLLSEIRDCSLQGFLGFSRNGSIQDCIFENNGFQSPIFYHHIYLSSPHSDNSNFRVYNNNLYRNAIVDGLCQAVSLVGHGSLHNIIIERNHIHEDLDTAAGTCYGIAIDTGYGLATNESFQNVVIRSNVLENMGSTVIGINACQDCVIENNVIIQEGSAHGYPISVPDRARNPYEREQTRTIIRGNSIYYSPETRCFGIKITDEGIGHIVVSNAIQALAPDSFAFRSELPSSAFTAFDYNIANVSMWIRNDSNYWTLDEWQTESQVFDTHSRNANPEYENTAESNLRPANQSSPLIDSGDPFYSSTIDSTNEVRIGLPDCGAFEFTSSISISEVSRSSEIPLSSCNAIPLSLLLVTFLIFIAVILS